MNNRFVASCLASVAVCVATSVPAFAQKWKIEYVWAGKSVVTRTDVPTVTTEWKGDGGNASVESSQGYGSMNAVSSGKVTVTGTWDPESSGQPTPPEVYLIITGSASAETKQTRSLNNQAPNPSYNASASANVPNAVTVRDPVVPPPIPSGQAESVTQSPDKANWEKIGTSGGTFEKTISLSGSTGISFNGNSGLATSKIGFSCGISIHAIPYNLRIIKAQTNVVEKSLIFTYQYDSTTGKVADLASCRQYERVRYPGGNPYIPPASFVGAFDNPDFAPPYSDPSSLMTFGFIIDEHFQTATSAPYQAASYSAEQDYLYIDSFTGEENVLIPSATGVNQNTIIRTLELRSGTKYVPFLWWTSVSKHGQTIWKIAGQGIASPITELPGVPTPPTGTIEGKLE